MCGIFGYIGKENHTASMVLEGLKLLEYRGYDSWGIAIKSLNSKKPAENKFIIDRHVGKISDAKLSSNIYSLKSNLAIGHTRWATHGGVTLENTHPHLDCKKEISVVHNGIIENYAKLKEELIKKGHKFSSETDTEVVAHLVEDCLRKNGKKIGFSSSVREVFNSLKGLNAIVVAYAPSREIVAAKTGSPLVVGKNADGLFIASDASGIIRHTRKLLFLKDKEMVILGNDVQLISLPTGEKIKPVFEEVDWKIEDANKGRFDHFMLKEIYEQPRVIRNISQNYTDQILLLKKVVEKAKGTFFIGAGTAFNACLVGSYLFSKIAKMHMNTLVASEFNYLEHFLTKKSLIIALSQSGETIDVVEPLNRAKEKGSKIFALTNSLGSTIYRMSDYKILLGAGPETAVASTKAYIAKLSILLMLTFAMVDRIDDARKLLMQAADEVDKLFEKKNLSKIKKLVSLIGSREHIYIIGRGVSYPTALESALKIKEVSYIHTEGLAGGELKHGTIALISKGTPCIIFAPNDETYQSVIANAAEIKARGGMIIGISPLNSFVFDYWIEVSDVREAQIITQVVPLQLLAYFMAVNKGYDPDKPRNLAKSVTVK